MAESSMAAETPDPTPPTDDTHEEQEATTIAADTQPTPGPAAKKQEETAPAEEAPLLDGEAPTEKLPRIATASSLEEETTAIEKPSSSEEEPLKEPVSLEEMPMVVEPASPQDRTAEEPSLEETPTIVEPVLQDELVPAVAASHAEAASPPEPAATKETLPEPVTVKEEPPAVLWVPSQPLSGFYRVLLGLASLVSGIASITVNQLLLPAQIATLDPAHQLSSLSLVALAGLLAAFIASPIVGAFSDRTTGRFGRRRPWLLLGLIGGVASLLVMAFSTSMLMLLVGEVLMQIFFSFVYTTLTAVIPDQVPLRQRATVSAAVGIAPVVGNVIGLLVVSFLARGTQQGYFWLAAIAFVVIALFLLVFREKPLPHGTMPRFGFKTFFASFWHNPKKHPNFTLMWFSRSFLFLSYALFIFYLLSYLVNDVHLAVADATLRVATFQVISTGTMIVFAFISSWLADWLHRPRLFVVLGAVIMAGGLFLTAFVPLWQYILLASVLFGIGVGLYLAVGLELTMRILPQARDHGKDLGIMNIPLYLALIVAPPLVGLVLNLSGSYTILFSLAGGIALLAGVLVAPVNLQRS